MSYRNGSGDTDVRRRGLALAALGLTFASASVAPARETPLQRSYSTDPHMTCDALQEEIARMDAIIAEKGTAAAVMQTARDRKQRIGAILKSRSCAPAPAKVFGPDMYDLPGTAKTPR